MASQDVHYFGIRHHGPGCARSLLAALEVLQPDCLLVEGPPEADALLHFIGSAGLAPPVALLVYNADEPARSAFFPFAEYSPEWQALRHAQAHGIPARFIDLPQAFQLLPLVEAPAGEAAADEAAADVAAGDPAPVDAAVAATPAPAVRQDPLGWLAEAAGFGDGESWWNHLVEERIDATDLFAAIAEAMTLLRSEFPGEATPEEQLREARREAHMRRCIREAQKEGHQRIAVVCGAWHVPALAAPARVSADNDLLKGLPKVKVAATWVPWTYRHLAIASGYGAGVESPGWYEHLWRQPPERRGAAWMARVGQLLRARDLECSPAQIIDATRLADTLAALRERANVGLDDINEAILATLCMGDPAPLALIRRELMVGDRLGQVPTEVPTVALQKDLERQQKKLRLKAEALEKLLDLDLREPTGLARSHLLHRLRLLGIAWGEPERDAVNSKGSFHEHWRLQWQPEFAVAIVQASRLGSTVEQAAAAAVAEHARAAARLADLTALLEQVLLADLAAALPQVMRLLADQAAVTGDVMQLLDALPPLVRARRYGAVRRTSGELLQPVIDGLLARACSGLAPACQALGDEAAEQMRSRLAAVDQAIHLLDDDAHVAEWRAALAGLAPPGNSHGLVSGLAARLLFDAGADGEQATTWLSQALSVGSAPADAAAWLEGFLHQGGLLLLHDPRLWKAVDDWLLALSDDHFLHALPLVRRTFASFNAHERQQLNGLARQGRLVAAESAAAAGWDEARAALLLPFLQRLYVTET